MDAGVCGVSGATAAAAAAGSCSARFFSSVGLVIILGISLLL